jgi:hypothetical protein
MREEAMFCVRKEWHFAQLVPVAMVGWVITLLAGFHPAAAQIEPSEVIRYDMGRFGLSTLSVTMPSLVYRPIDELSVRPGGAPQGMGGAYLARAEGTLAVGWEPAGLASLERPSLVVEGYTFGANSRTSGYPDSLFIPASPPLVTSSFSINLKSGVRVGFLSGGTPIWSSGGMRLAGALSWRRYADLIKPESVISDLVFGRERGFPVTLSMDITEKGAIESFAPSLAFQATPMVSVGANLNFLTGRLSSSNLRRIATGGYPVDAITKANFKYSGFVPDFGLRVIPVVDRIQVAARLSPSYKLRVRGGAFSSSSFAVPGEPMVVATGRVQGYDLEIPAAVGVGAALRPLDRLWVTCDWNQHKWSQTKLSYTDTPEDLPSQLSNSLPYRDVTSFHLGAEYMLHRWKWGELPVRVGWHTSPQANSQLDRRDVAIDSTYAPTLIVTPAGTYNGKQDKATAYSFGASLRTGGVDYDLGVENTSFTDNEWYLDVPWDLVGNPNMTILAVKRTVTRIHLSATCGF